MKSVHVVLVSDQPIPNLTTILQFRPDQVVLLFTDDKRIQKERLEKVISKRSCKVESRKIEAYTMSNVVQVCESLISDYVSCNLSLNITGGTKIGTLGAYQVFYTASLPIYYVNTRNNEILQVSPTETSIPIKVTIGINEYLEAHGFNVKLSCDVFDGLKAHREATNALRDLAITSENLIGKLNSSFPDNHERVSYPLNTQPLDSELLCKIATPLQKHEIATVSKNGGLKIETMENATYIRGGWFEELVAMAALDAGADEVAMNVIGQWDSGGRKQPSNEFDVMLTKGIRLFLISCKTRYNYSSHGNEGIAKEFLYELDSIGDQALGIFGGKMLASARSIKDEYVRKRAQVMNIKILDNSELPSLKRKIQEWISR